ncbi:MAG: hypothetical protein K2W96_16625, partial [Gemmataceae bacterium]|nr:hypothetical protein [Gemmataceae bacterium]
VRATFVYSNAGDKLVGIEDGIRTSTTFDIAGRPLVSVSPAGRTTFTHDAAGNRTRTEAPASTTFFGWDSRGRMATAEPPAGTTTMTYDTEGRRLRKDAPTGSSTRFLFDHDKVLQEDDGSGGGTKGYISTEGEYGDLLSAWGGVSGAQHYAFDASGSAEALLAPDGSVADKWSYRAFGLSSQTSGTDQNRFQWVGKLGYQADTEWGLYLLRDRSYDPDLGRFVSPDPDGLAAGDPNLFRYCVNDPLAKSDPSGRRILVWEEDCTTRTGWWEVTVHRHWDNNLPVVLFSEKAYTAYAVRAKTPTGRPSLLRGFEDVKGYNYAELNLFDVMPSEFWAKVRQRENLGGLSTEIEKSMQDDRVMGFKLDSGGLDLKWSDPVSSWFHYASRVSKVFQEAIRAASGFFGALTRALGRAVLRAILAGVAALLKAAGMPDPNKFIDTINRFADNLVKVASAVLFNPIGFLEKLAGAALDGVEKFVQPDTLLGHLKSAVFGWLASPTQGEDKKPASIPELPKDASAEAITGFGLGLMGITKDRLLGLAAGAFGEEALGAAMQAWELLDKAGSLGKLATKGFEGFSLASLGSADVLGLAAEGANTVMPAILAAAAKKALEKLITATTPAGAALLLFEALTWVVKNIVDFLVLADVADGKNREAVAEKVNTTLGSGLKLAFSFLASQLGLDGLRDTALGGIATMQSKVEEKLKKLIDGLAEKALGWLGIGAKGGGAGALAPPQEIVAGKEKHTWQPRWAAAGKAVPGAKAGKGLRIVAHSAGELELVAIAEALEKDKPSGKEAKEAQGKVAAPLKELKKQDPALRKGDEAAERIEKAEKAKQAAKKAVAAGGKAPTTKVAEPTDADLTAVKDALVARGVVSEEGKKLAEILLPLPYCVLRLYMGKAGGHGCFWAGHAWRDWMKRQRLVEDRSATGLLAEAEEWFVPGPRPDPAALRLLRVRLDHGGGEWTLADLIRSLEWLASKGAVEGGTFWLEMPEQGVVGWAKVEGIDPCPPLAEGKGALVTGWFAHSRARAHGLRLAGSEEVLAITGRHPVWSKDRGDWVPVAELRRGEGVELEEGRTGVVESADLLPGEEPVYNIEVEGQHCYRVGEQGLLVHNASAVGPADITLDAAQMMQLQSLAQERVSLGLPVAGSATDTSTLVKLLIGGHTIWGINRTTGGRTQAQLQRYNEDARCCHSRGTGATSATLDHAEADSIFQAYDRHITANTAIMYCDRPLCGYCRTSLANLLCLALNQTLLWIGPNATRTGYVTYTFTVPT